ncbi:RING-H2 finger protein ATL40-like [Quercus robur]|uniref:RING-H2 finger protein ATL40-like n=1 Tax=Quercus robur TaxID=38942 RepID=UPI002162604E|nr:RING-H2 finger protein ATL40-like [Quercus robur]
MILQIHFRNQETRRQASLDTRTTQVALDEIHSIEPTPMRALEPLVVASLPKFMYKQTDQLDHGHEVIECSVCLGTIVEEAMVKLLPNCKHMFHVECIDMWLNSNITCPICRTLAEPRDKPEDSTLCTVVQPLDPPIEDSMPHGTRLSSFQRMLSMERSSRGIQSRGDEGSPEDLERQ